ncbi:DUF3299 domain-containing protein [Pseudofulvimonas gallinarii]|jgi:hypothetical protein|uniref:DUF3299 domain-containing protein n=1 Tax=Pseudofulvimonas gallinarii TaxID=634155 RepID=A0A4S3KZW8_9GAMM|nr:DUF3299 domain-containing protein [Pseudofulvimonas gallinarii]TCT01203.1 hypothetical protein EDC25_10158 [Pseudofulvimonas gallinarii]THD14969.1 hypothetical protein B1808_00765 [Pseudofulvimonas gallinarii]
MKPFLLSTLLTLVAGVVVAADAPRELDWLELMPKDEVELLNQAPEISHDGTFRMEQQGSFRTIAGLDGQHVKLPGYIVPVDVSEDQKMSSFFLVPYFGACVHVPPPPPNQIVFVTLREPMAVTDMYDAFWIEGTLKVQRVQKDIAASAYVLEADKVSLYEG